MHQSGTFVLAATLLVGCGHITHGADVEQGLRLGGSVARGLASTGNYGSPERMGTTGEVIAQGFGGYTLKAESGMALSLTAALQYHSLPYTDLATNSTPKTLWLGYLDVYGQLVSGPLDFGTGVLLGPMEPYVELEHRFTVAEAPADVSGGLRVGLLNADGMRMMTPFVIASVAVKNALRVGAFAEYAIALDGHATLCDECYSTPQFLRNEFSVGLMVQLP